MVLDWKKYEDKAREAVTEGIVLLKNENNVLPLEAGSKIAVFGRMQNNYYKSGTGSGGMVNVDKVWSIMDALELEDVKINEDIRQRYLEFEKELPFNKGVGFGNEPWSQPEMPLDPKKVEEASQESDVAIVVIGRTAGEEQDFTDTPGAYRLAAFEVDMLEKVRNAFEKVILLMNTCAVLDMTDIERISPDAILMIWTGGEIGGLGTSDVLMGRVSPSGHLTDSIIKSLEDASASKYFGNLNSNAYGEDIYVGYRYYETFNKDAVLYPFGYGLSYTQFEIMANAFAMDDKPCIDIPKISTVPFSVSITVTVKNIGDYAGKEVIQSYVSLPQGKLGQPALQLVGFAKTKLLEPGESQTLEISTTRSTYASYDDSGVTGNPYAYQYEAGEYKFFIGNNVRSLQAAGGFVLTQPYVIEKLSRQMAPSRAFQRIRPEEQADGTFKIAYEDVPFDANGLVEAARAAGEEASAAKRFADDLKALADQPDCKPYTGDQGIKLKDVRDKKASMEDFLAQLSDEDLTAIVRGEGMGSPRVTPGTAAAFGGVSNRLNAFGIPAGCCSDGPSGMRLDCGARAFSLPSGTMLACTWNTELNTELYSFQSIEMYKNNVDALLGPGINIHRHPLNGRNFEYFSEDPFLTGQIASAQIKGLQSAGNTGTIKHFCANNQESNRNLLESVVSERALRQIYLKPFELAVKNGANSVMTSYGVVNGIWTNSRHDLNTEILRGEWGFQGIVMTDWWSNIGDLETGYSKNDFARMVRAGNDFYAVCAEAAVNSTNDNLMKEVEEGTLTRGQLVRNAHHICQFLMNTHAMARMLGEDEKVELLNYVSSEKDLDPSKIHYVEIKDGASIDMRDVCTDRGEEFVFGVDAVERGLYKISFTASSDLEELAQINVTLFVQNIPYRNFSFTGTHGEDVTLSQEMLFHNRYETIRMHFGGSGLAAKEMRFDLLKPDSEFSDADVKAFYESFGVS